MKVRHKLTVGEILLIAALFCFSISLFNKGGYIFAFMSVIVLFLNFNKIKISLPVLFLMLFSVSYFLIHTYWHGYNIENMVKYLIGPWAAYFVGKIYVETSNARNPLLTIVLVLSAGMLLHGTLNIFAYLNSNLYNTYSYQRVAVDIWRNEIVSATVTGMFYTFATGISIGTLFSKARARYKVLAAAILISTLSFSLFLANRTLLVIVALVVLFKAVSAAASTRVSPTIKVLSLLVGTLFLLLIIMAFSFNWGGITDWFLSLKIVQRYDDPAGRLSAWSSMFKDGVWLEHPFGSPKNSFRHNLWIDVYGEVGIIPFVLIVGLTIYYIKRFFVFRRISNERGENTTYCVMQCLFIAVMLNCAVEPVIVANPYFFLIVLMFVGAMEGYRVIER